eukprot:c45834_g1_i1 orf=71-271(+)
MKQKSENQLPLCKKERQNQTRRTATRIAKAFIQWMKKRDMARCARASGQSPISDKRMAPCTSSLFA